MSKKSILITGCSSGIGYCAATRLKLRGYRVFASVRHPADQARLQAEGLESVIIDLTQPASIQQGLSWVLEQTGGALDALFNNAGCLVAGATEDLTPDMIRQQFETNVFGPIELTRLVLPVMRKQGYGRLIFNSSILGLITIPYYGAYNASKFALEGFAGTLRQECRGTGIHVSIINPGPITSKLRDHAFDYYQQTLQSNTQSAYRHVYQQLEENYFTKTTRNQKISQSPDRVVDKLIHALESRHPRTHYLIGFPMQLLGFMRRLLPDRALDWLLSKVK